MKRALLSIIAILSLSAVIAAPLRQTLHDGWQFKQQRGTNWYNATVPGVVQTGLSAKDFQKQLRITDLQKTQ